jgi:DNA-binding FrmR family transcriptional regulator
MLVRFDHREHFMFPCPDPSGRRHEKKSGATNRFLFKRHDTYPHRYSASFEHGIIPLRMSHTIKNKQKLILRSKRIRGQFEALERVLDEGRDCSEVLQIISAARGAVNSLMTELLEGHIRHHVLDPKRRPNSEQTLAADEVIDMVKTYLR